jgi:hypothetical protein
METRRALLVTNPNIASIREFAYIHISYIFDTVYTNTLIRPLQLGSINP